MPFNIGGEWIPEPAPKKASQPVKVRTEKRGSSTVTVIMHLPYENSQLKNICSSLKKRIGCGGSLKDGIIELQGDQVDVVKQYLKEL